MIKRYPILKIWTDRISVQEGLQQVDEFALKGNRLRTIISANPEKNYSVPSDPMLYQAFKDADLLLPDGVGVVLAAKLLHNIKIRRVPGCEFMLHICAHAHVQGYKIFIYGAKDEVNKGAVKKLSERYPGLNIVGRCHGYWPDDRMDQLVEMINSSGAQILFLALGSPRQEHWIANYRAQLSSVRVCQCIGGTLDVINGNVKRAPAIFCRCGLEWLYRLISDPTRITRQWVLPIFMAQMLSLKVRCMLSGKLPGEIG